jgi:Cu(I)/Ag(I) efflux system membrane fusion protein
LTAAQESLADAARRRLELWDVPADEIEALEKTGAPQKSLIMRSKLNGTVLMKDAYEGHRVTPDRELFVIADLSTVWVQSKVFEYELPHVELGRPATVRVPSLPGQEFIGKVDFIGPTLDEATRTVRVRVELANPEGAFKPGMFLNIEIQHEMGEGLLAPTSAVTRTGERDIAFRVESGDEHGDRIVPVEVKLDTIKFGDRFHIVEGLEAGDKVVTSANFLIDSESRLHSGGGDSAGMGGMNMGGMQMDGMKGMDHSKMKGMDHSKMKGMDDSKMKGMDHSKMKH